MKNKLIKNHRQFIIVLTLLLLSALLSFYNFYIFHLSVIIYSVIICFIILIIILNTHQIISNNYYIFLGITFGFIGFFEILHAFFFLEINFLPFLTSDIAGQIWYLNRFTLVLAILIPLALGNNKLKIKRVLTIFILYTVSILITIIYFNIPLFDYIPNINTSYFSLNNSYIIIILAFITLYILRKSSSNFNKFHYMNMETAVIFLLISESFFLFEPSLGDLSTVFGHISRLLTFYFIYRSVVLIGLKEPYNSIFYKLMQSNKKLTDLNQILNIVKNIHETININYELNTLFENIIDILIKKEDFQLAFIGKYNQEEAIIEIKSSVGSTKDFLKENNIDLEKDYNSITQAIKKRKIIKDDNPQFVDNIFKKTNNNIHKSLIALPIYYDNIIYGILVITSYKEDAFSDNVVELLNKITQNLGIAISRYQTQKKISYLSFHDQLTGLYNKNFFNEEIERLNTSRKLPISIIISDFNNLKLVNDSYGHKIGDKFLKTYAEILKKNSRQEDIIARWGGDEFVILLPNADRKGTELLLERIKTAVDNVKIAGEKMSIALGYAIKETPDQDIQDVFKQADKNMYRNKKIMKNNDRENLK